MALSSRRCGWKASETRRNLRWRWLSSAPQLRQYSALASPVCSIDQGTDLGPAVAPPACSSYAMLLPSSLVTALHLLLNCSRQITYVKYCRCQRRSQLRAELLSIESQPSLNRPSTSQRSTYILCYPSLLSI